jgi:hypothetical protein
VALDHDPLEGRRMPERGTGTGNYVGCFVVRQRITVTVPDSMIRRVRWTAHMTAPQQTHGQKNRAWFNCGRLKVTLLAATMRSFSFVTAAQHRRYSFAVVISGPRECNPALNHAKNRMR